MIESPQKTDDAIIEARARLLGSLLTFTQTFYKLRTGRDFALSHPVSRESHYITICRALMRVYRGECKRLIINVPPRYGKTELLIHFVAWALARNPDSNFIYVSYSHGLAKKQTQTIRNIVGSAYYRKMFGVEIAEANSAKDDFETINGGSVYATGAGGTITGRGAGIQNCAQFGGGIIIDDIHKPDEVTSDTIREGVIDWFYNTLNSRTNSPNTPIIFIGQCLHEDDLAAHLKRNPDWEVVSIPAIDRAGNVLNPSMHDKQTFLKMMEENPYVFSAQYQQDPQPAGGGIFKPEWFYLTENAPHPLVTFVTADTAETDKDYNDATVFSFWGLYKVDAFGFETNQYGLQWIDCAQLRIEPKDLKAEFVEFYAQCMQHKVKPALVAIEKKSTGTTLLSILKDMQGIDIREIERTKASGNKTARFLEMQEFVAKKLISLPRYGKHTHMCIEHMRKITANNTHRHDDIADTLYDAIKIALIDKTLNFYYQQDDHADNVLNALLSKHESIQQLSRRAYG